MNVWIVVAAFNESKRVEVVVDKLRAAGYYNVVIVNDGSSDDTGYYCTISHAINLGQGASLQTGIDYALLQGADVIVTFDADGQHQVEDLPAMLVPLSEGFDIVFGSRFLKENNIPAVKKVMLKVGVFVIWLFYGVRMSDSHNGFRSMNRRAAELIRITSDRMEHASQFVEETKKHKLRFTEVPVTIIYEGIRVGSGNFKQSVKVLLKMVYRRLFQ